MSALVVSVLVSVSAAQADVPQGVAVPAHVPRALDSKAAAEICTYSDKDAAWHCDSTKLAHFDLSIEERIEGSNSADARFVTLRGKSPCVGAIGLHLASPTDEIVVDWTHVAFVVDGRALQAVPGYARELTSSLQQRSSVAPAGSALEEAVFPITGGDCLNEPANLPPDKAADDLALVLPFSVGGRAEQVTYHRHRSWVAKTESEALDALGPPPVPPAPKSPRPDNIGSPPFHIPFLGILGGLIGLGGAAGVGYAYGYYGPPKNGDSQLPAAIGCGVCVSPLGVGAIGGIGLAGDALINSGSDDEYRHASSRVSELQNEWSAYELAKRKRAAWDKRRSELTAVPAATAPPSAAAAAPGVSP
jgi:hypothetical protein